MNSSPPTASTPATRWAQRIAYLFLTGFLALVPFSAQLGSTMSSHDVARLGQLFLLLIFAAACLATSNEAARARTTGPIVLFAISISIIAAVATAFAPHSTSALRELLLVLGLVGSVSCIANISFECRFRAILLYVVGPAAIYGAVVLLVVGTAVTAGIELAGGDIFFGYENYRFYSHVQTVYLPLSAVLILGCKRPSSQAAGWCALILGFALLLLGTGRATAVGLIAGCGAALMLFGRSAIRFLLIMVAGATAGALLYCFLMYGLPWALHLQPPDALLNNVADTGSYEARVFLWKIAVEYLRESPWLGIGPMHYAHRVNFEAAHPHNIYLQIAAEWGLPMLISLVLGSFCALWWFARLIRSSSSTVERMIGTGLFAGCVAVAVDGFFSGNFVMPMSQMWIALLFGLSIAWYRSQAPKNAKDFVSVRSSAVHYLPRASLAAALVGSQLCLLCNVYHEAVRLANHLAHVQKDMAPNPRINPRFWSHGWF